MTRQEKISAIRSLPITLSEAVRGLSDEQLDTPYRDGGWTARQVVHHLADSHLNAFIRTKLILTEDHPTIKPYSQNDWAETVDSKAAIGSSLSIIEGLHERWSDLFDGMTEADWSRAGLHPETGELSIDRILDIYHNHGKKHVEHIMGLRRKMQW